MPNWTPTDCEHMRLALSLAHKGQGFVEPNPMVGCVLTKGKRIIGRGFHRICGGPHAEPNALREAGPGARGATAYVTLEPCGHVGKTPPCTDALRAAGIRRVVVAMKDPNPLVSGKGLRALRAAGIQVDVGLLRKEALGLNAPFVTYHTKERPYVILKWAQSIDGKIATRKGDSKWITSRQSRAAAHALRARVDAIIAGVDTVIADDPELTARHCRPRRQATRIILDTDLKTPPRAKVVRTARQTPTLIVAGNGLRAGHASGRGGASTTTAAGRRRRAGRLRAAGCDLLELPSDNAGVSLPRLLCDLRARQMTNILVEGGGRVLGAFLQAGLADEAYIFVAPRLIGGETAPGPLRGIGPATMANLPPTSLVAITQYGPDLCYNIKFG